MARDGELAIGSQDDGRGQGDRRPGHLGGLSEGHGHHGRRAGSRGDSWPPGLLVLVGTGAWGVAGRIKSTWSGTEVHVPFALTKGSGQCPPDPLPLSTLGPFVGRREEPDTLGGRVSLVQEEPGPDLPVADDVEGV